MRKLLIIALLIVGCVFGDTIIKSSFAGNLTIKDVKFIKVEHNMVLYEYNGKQKTVKCSKIIEIVDNDGNPIEYDCNKIINEELIIINKTDKKESKLVHVSGFGFTFNIGSSMMNLLTIIDGAGMNLSPTVYYIHYLSNSKRIEPSLGYFSVSSEGESSSITTFGVGYLADRIQSNNFETYLGGRFSITMVSDEDDSALSISPVCGAEYSFSDNFSIGGEARFNYSLNTGDDELSTMDISSHLFFRFYK
jgi:hypothetical protein